MLAQFSIIIIYTEEKICPTFFAAFVESVIVLLQGIIVSGFPCYSRRLLSWLFCIHFYT